MKYNEIFYGIPQGCQRDTMEYIYIMHIYIYIYIQPIRCLGSWVCLNSGCLHQFIGIKWKYHMDYIYIPILGKHPKWSYYTTTIFSLLIPWSLRLGLCLNGNDYDEQPNVNRWQGLTCARWSVGDHWNSQKFCLL
jgi:hypothetical protein